MKIITIRGTMVTMKMATEEMTVMTDARRGPTDVPFAASIAQRANVWNSKRTSTNARKGGQAFSRDMRWGQQNYVRRFGSRVK